MTEDELEALCVQAKFDVENAETYHEGIHLLMAFAKRQQAVGLREAKDKIVYSMKIGSAMPMREQVIDWLESQAEERER